MAIKIYILLENYEINDIILDRILNFIKLDVLCSIDNKLTKNEVNKNWITNYILNRMYENNIIQIYDDIYNQESLIFTDDIDDATIRIITKYLGLKDDKLDFITMIESLKEIFINLGKSLNINYNDKLKDIKYKYLKYKNKYLKKISIK